MIYLVVFMTVLFVTFLTSLLLSRQKIPQGVDHRGRTIVTTDVRVEFCLAVACVIATLTVLLLLAYVN